MKQLALMMMGTVLTGVLCEPGPIVEAPAGTFQGHLLKTRNGRDILSFQGIPYAKPPLGQLRFKDPVAMPKLEGIYNATDGFKQCFQPTLNLTQISDLSAYSGSEDCLYLNVYKPKVAEGSPALPVMVWIHGGGFVMGSGSIFWNSPEFLLDKDMIMVTLNYRLGILGFLFDGDKGIAGNFGMKDQIMALKWVQDNVAAFGGDPKQVTLAGQSAGGAAVSLLMHSPLATGLFDKVIAQSGTAFSAFALHPQQVAFDVFTRAVVEDLGCSNTKQLLLKCLQKISLEELIKSALLFTPEEQLFSMDFIPVLERPSPTAFITEESLKQPSSLPLMLGVTSKETMTMLAALVGGSKKFKGDVTKINQGLERLMPIWGGYRFNSNKANLTDQLAQYYFGQTNTSSATYLQMSDYMSDIMFNHGAHKAAHTEEGPVYLYQFSYQGDRVGPFTPPQSVKDGAGHGDELRYLLKTFVAPTEKWSDKDLAMSQTMVDLWFNFVKHGDPTPESKLWQESGKGSKYLDIGEDGLVVKSDMFKERMEFLDKLDIDRFHQVA